VRNIIKDKATMANSVQDAIHNVWSGFTELLDTVRHKQNIDEMMEMVDKLAALQLAEEQKHMDDENAHIMTNVYNDFFKSCKCIMRNLRNKEYHMSAPINPIQN